MAEIVETVPFNFNDIYTELQTKFDEKGYDIEEGSNTSQLITAMAYLTSMLNVNTAVNINETLLPLATKRDNALVDARILGYEISHKQSYKYRLTLTFTAGDHTIPKYSEFSADGKTYYFMGDSVELLDVPDGYTTTIDVKEGTLYKFDDYADTLRVITGTVKDEYDEDVPQYYIDIPYVDVEENGIEVFLTYYDADANLNYRETWYRSEQFMVDADTVLNKRYIRMDNVEFKTPRIYFKYAGIGQGVRQESIVEMNILTTSGKDGGLTSDFSDQTNAKSIFSHSFDFFEITNIDLINEGSEEEDIVSIQRNAPMFYNSANRAITKQDYVAFCNRHQAVKYSEVWGGEDEYPKTPGHIWFSFFPYTYTREFNKNATVTLIELASPNNTDNWFVEDEEIFNPDYDEDKQMVESNAGVWNVLDYYKIPTMVFHNRHPIYLDFFYDINILVYNIKTSKGDINNEVFDVINSYFLGTTQYDSLETFGVEYFHSNLEKRIDSELSDVTGFNNEVQTKLLLTNKNISYENENKKDTDIFIPLAKPYEKMYDENGVLQIKYMPNIDGTFIDDEISVDWSSIENVEKLADERVLSVPIYYGENICGEYYIFNEINEDIMVRLFINNDIEVNEETRLDEYANTPLNIGMFQNSEGESISQYLNLTYRSPNFKVIKNVLPRLRQITFE